MQPGEHEGYVDWDRAEAIRKMLTASLARFPFIKKVFR